MAKTMTVIIPESLNAKLGFVAHIQDKLPGEVVRDAIRFFLDEHEDWADTDWDSLELEDVEPEPEPEPEPTCAECGAELTHGHIVLEDGTALCNECQLKLDRLAEVRELAETELPKHEIPPPPDDE